MRRGRAPLPRSPQTSVSAVGRAAPSRRRGPAARRLGNPDARTVASVLGEPAQLRVITPKARAARFARTLTAAKKGVWVTYKAYPAESRQLAHVAAHDLRKGKVRALALAGPIDVRVADAPDGRVAVQVARGGPDAPARAPAARKTAPRAVNAPIRRDPTPATAPDRPETWPKALQRILELLHQDGGWTSGAGRPTGADVEQFEDLTGQLLQCERVRGEPAFWSLLHRRDQSKAEQLWHALHEASTQ